MPPIGKWGPQVLRNARVWEDGGWTRRDVAVERERVVEAPAERTDHDVDLEGRALLPALVNAHDHLDFSTFPALGSPPYASVYEWTADVEAAAAEPRLRDALAVSLTDRLFLGGVRNLLSGASAVAHHGAHHRSLDREDFPVRVLSRYSFAHSPGLTPQLRRTYRTTDRRIPWIVHAGEGTDARCRAELLALEAANVLRQNTVIIHAIAFGPEEAARIAAARGCVVWCPESNRRLYGATTDVAAFRQAGVRVGLGSDSPVTGVRDPLSNLAAARREGALEDRELIELATAGSGEVARLPAGEIRPGGHADLLAVEDLEAFLQGNRRTVSLVVVAGRPLYGEASLLAGLGRRTATIIVDGRWKAIDADVGRRVSGLFRDHAAVRRSAWMDGIRFED